MITRNLFAGAFASLFAIVVQPADAATVYSYIGPNFSEFQDDPVPAGSYTSSMRLTGTFTVANPLLNVNGNIAGDLLSFSFFDGRNTVNNLNAVNFFFNVQTDPTGNLLTWDIEALTAFPTTVGGQRWGIAPTSVPFLTNDTAIIEECLSVLGGSCATTGRDFASSGLEHSGVWSFADAVVTPLPAALPLFTGGLGVIGLLGWRRKKKVAALALGRTS